jgi:hypothetical protein
VGTQPRVGGGATVVTEYFVRNDRRIQVGAICVCTCSSD